MANRPVGMRERFSKGRFGCAILAAMVAMVLLAFNSGEAVDVATPDGQPTDVVPSFESRGKDLPQGSRPLAVRSQHVDSDVGAALFQAAGLTTSGIGEACRFERRHGQLSLCFGFDDNGRVRATCSHGPIAIGASGAGRVVDACVTSASAMDSHCECLVTGMEALPPRPDLKGRFVEGELVILTDWTAWQESKQQMVSTAAPLAKWLFALGQ